MEMDAHGFERKEQYETFYKDVMELVGEKTGYSNPGRAYLQPVKEETFKKYRRVGLLAVLFMARTLEAAPTEDYDENTIWWNQFARPTLVDTIAALHAQQQEREQQQQQEEEQEPVFEPLLRQATTVVMKLLLLYLDLTTEKTKDYGYQLGADLPLCSQFLLCRAIHIHSRDGDEGDDEEDDDNNANANPGNIVSEEDGAFILRSTSPSRGQASAAGLMFLLRLAFATAMVHADKTNSPKLRQALWSAAVFSYCQPVRDMAYRSKVCRYYAKIVTTGTARAEAVVDKEHGVTGWKISTAGNPQLVVHKSDLVSGVRKMVDDAQKIVKDVLKELTDLAADDTVGPILKRNIFETEPDLVAAMSYLPTSFFGRQVAFEDGKSRIDFQMVAAQPTPDQPLQ
jgi:hypothetical protein